MNLNEKNDFLLYAKFLSMERIFQDTSLESEGDVATSTDLDFVYDFENWKVR